MSTATSGMLQGKHTAQVGQRKRLVRVTAANLRNGHLYLTGHLGFFPAECFGGSSAGCGEGRALALDVAGLRQEVRTDIPTNPKTGKPRHFFRRREWVRKFFKVNRISAGDFVALEKTDRFRLSVYPAQAEEVRLFELRCDRRRATSPERPPSNKKRNVIEVAGKQYPWPVERPPAEVHVPDSGSGDIARVAQVDWTRFRFIDLFAGIGGIRLGFQHVGGRCVFSSEWDESAQETYAENFGERPHGDITKIDPLSIPDHDVLLAGFPCQPFSIIGERKGFSDTRGTLFFNVEEILRVKRPAVVMLENVKQFRTHDSGRTYRTVINRLVELGYYTHTAILNALHYGLPQRRERTFIVGFAADLQFQFPKPATKMASLAEVLEDDATLPSKVFASDAIKMKRLQRLREQGEQPFYPSVWHENKGGHLGVHPFSCALRHNASHNYLLVNGQRRLSPRECLRLQGFPDEYKIVVPHRAIRAQAGNSVAVHVIKAIAEEIRIAVLSRQIRGQSPSTEGLFGKAVQ